MGGSKSTKITTGPN